MRRRLNRNRIRNRIERNLSNENIVKSQEKKWLGFDRFFSIIAIIISVLTLVWTIYQDFNKNKEEIIINSFTPENNTKLSFENFALGKLITLDYGILISNTGENTISLVDYKLKQTAEGAPNRDNFYPLDYSGLSQGFNEKNGKATDMPFIIKSGESKLVFIKTGIIVHKRIYEKINSVHKQETGKDLSSVQNLTYSDLKYYEVKAGTDIYGNHVSGQVFQESSGEKSFTSITDITDKDYFQPTFSLTFKSAKGNYFVHLYNEFKPNNF
ncbi:hypothetical protein [Bacillus sp. V5-8f]|uniref:hypothetical protein n=1 Tax=Bacillus sp. V5-8f TaxID=2053044 RepID=UPI000C783BEA|nr:hypothetical protein [Bacillus sp. V5-8f]PLT32521.1 hypothetical protein CUU64_18620 [Bacillus sp. V5-8f]